MTADTVVGEAAEITSWSGADESIKELLGKWPYLPFLECRDVSRERRVAYLVAVLASAQRRGATTFVARADRKAQALMQWERLPWDTRMLGLEAARVSAMYRCPGTTAVAAQRELVDRVSAEARANGTQYLVTRVSAGDIIAVGQLENGGFRVVDGILNFGRPLVDLAYDNDARNVRRAVSGDIPALREIAGASFSIDRFHSDPAIGKDKADEIQRAWVENSVRGNADCVLVAEVGGEVAGFTTLKLDGTAERTLGIRVGTIELVATSPRFRRRGLARILSEASLAWFRDAGCSWAEVGTQAANIQAARVYQSAGFLLTASSLTLRRLL